jgi:hypothetical protein
MHLNSFPNSTMFNSYQQLANSFHLLAEVPVQYSITVAWRPVTENFSHK